MADFTLRQLEYLVASVDHKSIAGAAHALNVSQPTISVAISKLEDAFGIQLLARHHAKGVTITPFSEEFLDAARALLDHARQVQNLAQSAGSDVSGKLHLGSFSALASTVLPNLIATLAKEYPKIDLKLKEGSQEELIESLKTGQIDMAVLYDIDIPDFLQKVHLGKRYPYVLLGAGHRLSDAKDVSLSQLIDDPFILLDIDPSRNYFLGLFKDQGLTPKVAFSSPSLELVRGMVGQNLGYSILVTRPKGDVTHDGQKLIVKKLKDKTRSSDMVLVYPKNLKLSRVMQSMRSVVLDQMNGSNLGP